MRKACLSGALALLLAVSATGSIAGPNSGGTLVLHSTEIRYCADQGSMCDVYDDSGPITDCADVRSETLSSYFPKVIMVLASFHPTANPRLAGVAFGLAYGYPFFFITQAEGCGDFELHTDYWPTSGEGTAVTWRSAQTGSLVPVYAIAAYSYYTDPNTLDLIPHPVQGAVFADDSVPANVDPIADLGSLGFHTEGYAPCAEEASVPGACCLDDCSCIFVTEDQCDAAGGNFNGAGTNCDPNPCPCPPVGACCVGEDCSLRTKADCGSSGGEFLGVDVPCEPNPCQVTPTLEHSWGEVKQVFR